MACDDPEPYSNKSRKNSKAIQQRVDREGSCFDSQIWHAGSGQFVKEFESGLSNYIGCKHVIAVNSGTAALQVGISAIKKLSKTPSDVVPEVVTTPLSFAATANAALGSGCLPVFADVDPETLNINPVKAKEKITANTIAIEPVDVYGLPADLDSLRNGSRKDYPLLKMLRKP